MVGPKLSEIFERLTGRVAAVENNPRSEVTGGIQSMIFAALPAAGQPGRQVFVTNGRKIGEGVGAGTGVTAADDGTNWIHVATDTPVAV